MLHDELIVTENPAELSNVAKRQVYPFLLPDTEAEFHAACLWLFFFNPRFGLPGPPQELHQVVALPPFRFLYRNLLRVQKHRPVNPFAFAQLHAEIHPS